MRGTLNGARLAWLLCGGGAKWGQNIYELVFELSKPMHTFNELFLVMEKLKLGKNMATLLVELNCFLTRICSNCQYNSGIIEQPSFLVTFLKKFNSCRQNFEWKGSSPSNFSRIWSTIWVLILVQQTSFLETCEVVFCINFGPIVSCLKEAGKKAGNILKISSLTWIKKFEWMKKLLRMLPHHTMLTRPDF